MTWNYRLIRDEKGQLALYEVYYKGSKVKGMLEEPIFTGTKKEILIELDVMRQGLSQPVLNMGDIDNNSLYANRESKKDGKSGK